MEGQSRSSTNVSQLESKLQDLEEQLRNEERYRNNLQYNWSTARSVSV